MLSSQNEICIERARFFTEIYKKNESDPEIIKKAKAIAHTLKYMTIFIRDNEMLVGNETSKNLGEKITIELYNASERMNLEEARKRKLQNFHIKDEEIIQIEEIASFWKGRTLYDEIIPQRMLDEKIITKRDKLSAMAPNIAIQSGTNEGHLCAGYENLLKKGYKGILEQANTFQSLLDKTDLNYQEKFDFYEAIKIYYEAAIEFLIRYSNLATEMAVSETEKRRKQELLLISESLEFLSNNIPETFYQAILLIWFTQNIANIIYHRSVLALGRLDQLLWPYYKKDIEQHRITRTEALELIEEINLKLTWNCTLLPSDYANAANALGLNTQTITISGADKNGKDATNELSYLFLEAYKNLKVFTSDLSIRIHKDTPKDFLLEALKVFRSTSGIAFYNDDVIVPANEKAGYTKEDARDYVIIGCVEPTSQGNTYGATGQMFLNLPGVLELVLNNGFSGFNQQKEEFETGDPSSLTTYEQFLDAFKKQLEYNIKKSVKIATIMDEEAMKWCQQPFISATLDNCLEKGKGYTKGGTKYNFSSITAYSFGTLVNSIYNIKKIVYDEKLMSLSELVEILNSNYKKQNVLRKQLKNKYQQWGNDKEEIDSLACELWDLYCNEVTKHPTIRGGRFNPGAYTMGIHVLEGLFTKATPDGRKAFQPLSNSLSPVNQTEKNGLTATLNSIAKLNYDLATNGVAVNVRIHPQNLETEDNIEKFYYLLKAYFDNGGMQIQPNVVSTETLKDAQIHPENYQDLIVKVGGYNATFIDLGKPIQNDIIDRLENTL